MIFILYEFSGRPFKLFSSMNEVVQWAEKNKMIRMGETIWKDEDNYEYGVVVLPEPNSPN